MLDVLTRTSGAVGHMERPIDPETFADRLEELSAD